MKAQWFLAGHPLVSLAPQQIVDCDNVDQVTTEIFKRVKIHQGCNGGDTPTAYQYVINTTGIESEKNYPYQVGPKLSSVTYMT
jgi:cathepsin F